MLQPRWLSLSALFLCVLVTTVASPAQTVSNNDNHHKTVKVIKVPGEDRFLPFAITVRVGTTVVWVNNDTDAHTIVSNDVFNTAGHRGTNVQIDPGGKFALTFNRVGQFPYYCRFHSMLDADMQPKAPGPDGGIQDRDGNYGTPMNGVITVVNDD
jgi:plastocyanin